MGEKYEFSLKQLIFLLKYIFLNMMDTGWVSGLNFINFNKKYFKASKLIKIATVKLNPRDIFL